jgi:hypothetical protein
VFVRTSTLVSPLGLLLFTGQPAMQRKSGDECTLRCGASGVSVDMHEMEGHAVLKLRAAFDLVLVQVSHTCANCFFVAIPTRFFVFGGLGLRI